MTSRHMRVRVAAVAAVAVLMCAPGLSSAQGYKWWQAEEVITELGLTPEQTRRLEEIFQKSLPALKALKTTLDTAEAELERLIERNDAAAMEQINTVEAARAELNKSRSLMLFNMRQVLTRDQWAKFTALEQAAERERARAPERRK